MIHRERKEPEGKEGGRSLGNGGWKRKKERGKSERKLTSFQRSVEIAANALLLTSLYSSPQACRIRT